MKFLLVSLAGIFGAFAQVAPFRNVSDTSGTEALAPEPRRPPWGAISPPRT
jgi:hypothetical protein